LNGIIALILRFFHRIRLLCYGQLRHSGWR